ETRVSMVKEPCFRFAHVALWNGEPPQKKIGVTKVSTAHCQLLNCSAGIMLTKTTGTDSRAETITRCFRSAASWSRAATMRDWPLSAGALSSSDSAAAEAIVKAP